MGPLIQWLFAGLASLVGPLIQYFGKRATIIATVVVAFTALTTTLATTMQILISTLPSTYGSDNIFTYVTVLFPSNFITCATAIVNAQLARAAYDYMAKIYDLSSK